VGGASGHIVATSLLAVGMFGAGLPGGGAAARVCRAIRDRKGDQYPWYRSPSDRPRGREGESGDVARHALVHLPASVARALISAAARGVKALLRRAPYSGAPTRLRGNRAARTYIIHPRHFRCLMQRHA